MIAPAGPSLVLIAINALGNHPGRCAIDTGLLDDDLDSINLLEQIEDSAGEPIRFGPSAQCLSPFDEIRMGALERRGQAVRE